MVEVLVEHDYSAQEPDELTIKKGDIIKDVIKRPGGWWEGSLNDKKGVFPDNFVRLIEKDSVVLRNKKDSTRIRQCRVVFSYNQDHEDELNLKVGDLINVICEEEEGWWRGVLHGKEGVFPSNFVEEVTPVQNRPKPSNREDLVRLSGEVPALPAKPVKQLCEVRYSYKAQNEDELSLKEGEIVTIITKDCQDPGWWKGELNGRVGVFPDNFVSILPFSVDDKKPGTNFKVDSKPSTDSSAIKPSSIASQRKSLEFKGTPPKPPETTKTTPPLPSKKPIISIKKSPSGSGSGLFSKIKDRIADAVDGATGSKPKTDAGKEKETAKENSGGTDTNASVFDQVERRPLLSDVRASRARAPGRRLPTSVYKEDDEEIPGLSNGTADHVKSEHSVKSEDSFRSEGSASSENLDNSSSDLDTGEVKPKLREWEKHKAPWLAEMKLNQAKRISVSPVPDPKPKMTPPDPEVSRSSHNSPADKEVNLLDMSKSMTDMKMSPVELKPVAKPYKTPPNELEKAPPIKKPVQPPKESPSRSVAPQPVKVSPKPKPDLYENAVITKSQSPTITTSHTSHITNFSHTSSEKVVSTSSTGVISGASTGLVMTSSSSSTNSKADGPVSLQMFNDVLERLVRLEGRCEKQGRQIEDLKNRLQVETDMRMMLQEKMMQNNVQV